MTGSLSDRFLCTGLILCLLMGMHARAFAAFEEIPDPAFRQCLNEIAKENKWSDFSDFKIIRCHNREIRSIEGIQKFVNLSSLSLYNNNLDTAHLSNFDRLEHLNLAGNALSKLHLVNLVMLKDCYVFNNQLEMLVVENAPKLTKLKANNNKLSELKLLHAGALNKLYIFDNELKEVDVQSLPALRYFDARHNPMPDEFYDFLDTIESLTALHDGNAEDW